MSNNSAIIDYSLLFLSQNFKQQKAAACRYNPSAAFNVVSIVLWSRSLVKCDNRTFSSPEKCDVTEGTHATWWGFKVSPDDEEHVWQTEKTRFNV